MTGRRRRLLVGVIWIAGLAAAVFVVATEFRLADRLNVFLPAGGTTVERLLLTRLTEGPAARLVPVAFRGGTPEGRRDAAWDAAAALRTVPGVARVEGAGRPAPEDFRPLFPYRYLLQDAPALSAEALRTALEARLDELRTPLAPALKVDLAQDPTASFRHLLQGWLERDERGPAVADGVWVAPDRARSLLLVELTAAAAAGEPSAIATPIRAALDEVADRHGVAALVAGAAFLTVASREAVRQSVQWLSGIATALITLALLWAYRSLWPCLFAAIVLGNAVLGGLALVLLVFGGIHGIAIAFAITLLGVAVDYPLHLLSHAGKGQPLRDAMPVVRRPLLLGAGTTMLAFATLATAGISGLAQMGLFVAVGLGCAVATVLLLLPALFPRASGPQQRHVVLPLPATRPRWLAPALLLALAASAVLLLARREVLFADDLAIFNPAPPELQRLDGQLRRDLGAAGLRHLLLVEAPDQEAVLQAEERLLPMLGLLQGGGDLGGFDLAARYLPSMARQAARQAALPDDAALRTALDGASAGLPFRAAAFAPFATAIAATRVLEPLDPAAWLELFGGTPLGPAVVPLLETREGRSFGFVTLAELRDPEALRAALAAHGSDGVTLHLVDLPALSGGILRQFRDAALLRAGLGTLLIAGILLVVLRRPADAARIVLVLLGATLATAACLSLLGIRLSLFHILAGLLLIGLAVDYGVFVQHASDPAAGTPTGLAATRHAVGVCALSTLIAFALLAAAPFAILQAIGITVTVGTIMALLFAYGLLMPRQPTMYDAAVRSAEPGSAIVRRG